MTRRKPKIAVDRQAERACREHAQQPHSAYAAIPERDNQSLFSAGLIAEVLPRLWEQDPEAGRRSLEDLRRLTRGAQADMRLLLAELRPSTLTDAELGDLLHMLGNALAGRTNILDLTSDDSGEPHRLIEVDTIIFVVSGADSQNFGHNFLRRITINAGLADAALSSFSWFYSAAINYDVNIANAAEGRLALLARPHLTTLSGTPAKFMAGGDVACPPRAPRATP